MARSMTNFGMGILEVNQVVGRAPTRRDRNLRAKADRAPGIYARTALLAPAGRGAQTSRAMTEQSKVGRLVLAMVKDPQLWVPLIALGAGLLVLHWVR